LNYAKAKAMVLGHDNIDHIFGFFVGEREIGSHLFLKDFGG
jgi:hypothetical protein